MSREATSARIVIAVLVGYVCLTVLAIVWALAIGLASWMLFGDAVHPTTEIRADWAFAFIPSFGLIGFIAGRIAQRLSLDSRSAFQAVFVPVAVCVGSLSVLTLFWQG
jgi:hypothetical protein